MGLSDDAGHSETARSINLSERISNHAQIHLRNWFVVRSFEFALGG